MTETVLDPAVVALLAQMGSAGRYRSLDSIRAAYRERVARVRQASLNGISRIDTTLGGVPVRIYRPPTRSLMPPHLYFHGGGFIVGSAFDGLQDRELAARARDAQCAVVSVDYRLAPEHPFPAALEDGFAAARAVQLGEEASLDPSRLSFGGSSAGGNLALGLSLLLKERSAPSPILQLLEIISTDMTMSSHAWRHPTFGHDVERAEARALQSLYYAKSDDEMDPHVSPLHATDLTGLAPVFMMSSEFDPRRDECEAFATRARDFGVLALSKKMKHHVHGSHMLPDWKPALKWRAQANSVLRKANIGVFDFFGSAARTATCARMRGHGTRDDGAA